MQRAVLFLALLVAAGAARAEPPPELAAGAKIAVFQLEGVGGATEADAAAVAAVVAQSIGSYGGFRVVTAADVQAILGFEATRQQLGCDEESCLGELSDALGVDYLVSGRVQRIGATHLLSLRLIDMRRVQVLRSVTRTVEGSMDIVIRMTPGATAELFGRTDDDARGGVVTVKVEAEEGIGFWGIAPWASLGVTAGVEDMFVVRARF